MENLNLNQEQIMMLKNKYSQMINDVLDKMDADISNMKVKSNIINSIIGIVVSVVGGIAGLGLGNLLFNISEFFLSINSSVAMGTSISNISGGISILSKILALVSAGGGFGLGFSIIGVHTSYSRKIVEIESDKQIFLMMERKKDLSDEEFLQFINNLNFSLSSSISNRRMSDDLLVDKLFHDLDFFEEYQNKNLINGLMKGKEHTKKHYKLNDEFREILKEYCGDIKTILDSLLKEAKGYDRYNKWVEEGKQRTNLYGVNHSLQNTTYYQQTYTGYDYPVSSPSKVEYPSTYSNPYSQQPPSMINSGGQYPQSPNSYITQPEEPPHSININYANQNIPTQTRINHNGYNGPINGMYNQNIYNPNEYYDEMNNPDLYNPEDNRGRRR